MGFARDIYNQRYRPLTVLLILFVSACWFSRTATAAESTADAFDRLSKQFQFFGVREFLYGRSDIRLADPAAMKAYLPILHEFTTRTDSIDDVLPLLKNQNPRVRLLAIMALFDKGADHALPDIHDLSGDSEATYPNPPVDQEGVQLSGIGPSREPQTVGEAANAVLNFYGAGGNPAAFDAYWQLRKDREHCASWYVVRLSRATHGTSPLPADSPARIQAVMKEVNQLLEADRRWTILHLAMWERGQSGTGYVASDAEVTQIARAIGAETLRKMIRSIPQPADAPRDAALPSDPDISVPDLAWFIYEHAKEMLNEKDADDVYAAGNVLVAAELRPAMASKWLHAQLENQTQTYQGWNRAHTLSALWRIVGPSETDFLVDHYFNDPVERGASPTERSAFLGECTGASRPEFRTLIAKIVTDARFNQTGPDSLHTVATIINGWTKKPVLSEDELNSMNGHDEAGAWGREFPQLADLQKRVRDSVPQWQEK